MTIGIDTRFLSEGKRTGVEEYTIYLLHSLFEMDSRNVYRLFYNSYRGLNGSVAQFGIYPNVEIYRFRYPNKLLNLFFKFLRYPHIDRLLGGCDILFYPNITFGANSSNCKVVSTFHDLSFVFHKEFLSVKKKIWHEFVNPKKQALISDHIIAVSAYTANDLVSNYGTSLNKISVVYSGVNPVTADIVKREDYVKNKYNLPDKFILYLGTLEPRKNVSGILKAFEILCKNGRINHGLVIAGSKGWLYHELFKLAKESKFQDKIKFAGFVDDKDKLVVYALADVFVFPSFYEGFGFPPLEAMSVGTPVVTSTVSSLPEVVGDAALLVNPYNINEIAMGIDNIINDKKLRNEFIKRGWERVRKFSWRRAATETLKVFERII
ncbi:MAG: glycosyl transferase group 1 [uncultured bacterium]|nr:MAG: glycosyl transferase group 1 [uncultured bacterium]